MATRPRAGVHAEVTVNKALLLLGLGSAAYLLTRGQSTGPINTNYPGPTCPPQATRLLFVGDSYAVGMMPYFKAKADSCNIAFAESVEIGSNITQWSSWIGPLLDAFDPTHVLFSQGGNDFGRDDPDRVHADIKNFLEEINEAGAVAMHIEPPTTPFADEIGVRDMWGLETGWLSGDDNYSIDSRQLSIPRIATDSLGHPTQAGYEKWANWIWPWFTERAGR